VTGDHRPGRILARTDLSRVPTAACQQTFPEQALKLWVRTVQLLPDTPSMAALRVMDGANVSQVPVAQGGDVVGILSRVQFLRY